MDSNLRINIGNHTEWLVKVRLNVLLLYLIKQFKDVLISLHISIRWENPLCIGYLLERVETSTGDELQVSLKLHKVAN